MENTNIKSIFKFHFSCQNSKVLKNSIFLTKNHFLSEKLIFEFWPRIRVQHSRKGQYNFSYNCGSYKLFVQLFCTIIFRTNFSYNYFSLVQRKVRTKNNCTKSIVRKVFVQKITVRKVHANHSCAKSYTAGYHN